MNKFFPGLALILLVSCQFQNEKSDNTAIRSFAMDTVMIDAGTDFINLKSGLRKSDLSTDKQFLYMLDAEKGAIIKIDLNSQKLIQSIPFEKEGPNGIGQWHRSFHVSEGPQFLIESSEICYVLDENAKKISQFVLDEQSLKGEAFPKGEIFNWHFIHADKGKTFYAFISSWMSKYNYFAVLDYESLAYTKFDLPGFELIEKFQFYLSSPSVMMVSIPEMGHFVANNKVIIWNEVFNTLFYYDIATGEFHEKNYESKLTDNQKKGKYPSKVESQEEFKTLRMALNEEITFSKPFWEEKTKKFYRISYLNLPPKTEGEERRRSNVFLSVFDSDLNLEEEIPLPQIQHQPYQHFGKDGAVWFFENIDDELAFVRVRLD